MRRSDERIMRLNSVLNTFRQVNQAIAHENERQRLIQRSCDLLAETPSYRLAWILLVDEARNFASLAAGPDKTVISFLTEQFKRGEYLQCAREVLSRESSFAACDDVQKRHKECPLVAYHKGGAGFSSRLEYGGRIYGLISVDVPRSSVMDDEEQGLFKELAGDIALALAKIEGEEKRKKAEDRVILTDRMASIGELASGVAHELNNPLTGIIGLSELILDAEVPDNVKDDLKVIHKEAQRAARIVQGLLTFARKQPREKHPTDINDTISRVLQLRAYEQKVSNINVITRFAPGLPQVMANEFQLQQVFMNIITNAEYFMLEAHGRGNLTVTTKRVGDTVCASFADDGPGIKKEVMEHLFTPFFTTKEVGNGTGLGLSICHGMVTEHGGRIYAESEAGKGATFVIELPVLSANDGGA